MAAFLRLTAEDFIRVGKNRQFSSWRPAKLLFIDSETTGLAGGTGTYIFLIGMARFQSDHLHIKQYYLLHQGMEYPFLQAALREWDGIEGLISFNGKSYDLPLLKTRLVLNRLPFRYENLPHLDLLHTARRLWKSLPSYSLSTLEEHVLHVRRESDIPGFMIPNAYFRSLLSGDLTVIEPVLQHNVIDLISMVGVTLSAARAFHEKYKGANTSLLGVMRTLADLDLLEEAAEVIPSIEHDACSREELALLLLYKARCLKRMHRWQEAVHIWQQYIAAGLAFSYEPYVELAKHYEHIGRDPHQALQYLEKAETRWQILTQLRNDREQHPDWLIDLSRRKARLMNKIK